MNLVCPNCERNYYFYIKEDAVVTCKTCEYVVGAIDYV